MISLTNLPWPPTMNHRFVPFRGRLILAPDHRKYKKTIEEKLHKNFLGLDASNLAGKFLKVSITYSGPISEWFTKDGRIKKKDVDNRHKSLLDGIFPFLDLDDSQIFRLSIKKMVGGDELVANVQIEEMEVA